LVEEFLSTIDGGAEVLRGRCLPYGEGITYFPVVEAIKQAAGLADFDLPDVVESKVCSVLEGDEHQELVCRHVAQLMGVAEAAAGEDTFWAIRRFFEASAGERPLVLVFDDIHWGEPTFLDLVEHIADWSRGSPILLLCMARSDLLDVRPSWGGGKLNAATVSLEPLTDDQATDLIANLLGAADLPAGIAERIVQTAEGNPLFVEEMLAMLVDDGVIVREDDRWIAAGDLSSVTVPPSIHALLDSRLDRLTPEEREVLEAAAVIGKEFFVGAVRDLVPQGRHALVPSDLLSLVRKELIRSERTTLPGEDAFRFRHLLVRDSAYEAIPKAQRAELHERFADWLERVAGEAVAEQEEILAYHLEQAHAYRLQLGPADERSDEVGARAADRLTSAGRRAAARGDHRAAANLLRRAVDLVPSSGVRRARLLYELGESTGWIADTTEAFAAYDEAVRLAADAGDRSLEWLARIRRSATQMLTEPHAQPTERFRAELEEARGAFEELEDDAALATVWTELAMIEWMPCRYDRATLAAERAIEHARRSGDERLVGGALVALIGAQMFGFATPEEGFRTLDALSEDLSDSPIHETVILAVRAFFTAMQGSFEEARRQMALASDVAESIGAEFFLSAHHEQLGHIELYAGDAEAAERAFRRNYESLEGLGDEGHGSTGAAMLGRVLYDLGRFEEAERYVEIALRIGAADDLATQVPARSTQALVHAARGQFAEADRLAREAVELFADAESPNLQGDAWLDLAQVLRMAGKPEDAGHAAGEALAFYERKGNRPASGTARAFIDGLGTSVK
jgi:tetratricopeptide (TPR) repeat protein